MLKQFTLASLLFATIANGQIFNRAIAYSDFDVVDNVSRQADFSYLLMNSNGFQVCKIDETGSFVDIDTLELSSPTSPYPLSMVGASIHVLSDSSFFVYGNYMIGCDVVDEAGLFVAHYSSDLDLLQSNIFTDTTKNMSLYNELLHVGTGQYALSTSSGLMGFDSNLSQTYFQSWSGDYIKGSVALPGNFALEVSQTLGGSTNSSYLHNLTTSSVAPGPQMDGNVYDVSDTIFSRINNGTLYLHHKSNLQAFDSIDIAGTIGFSHEHVRFQPDVILFADNGRYAVVSVDNLQLLKADSLHTVTDYTKFTGALSYKDSILVATTQLREGRFHIESFNINKPKALVFKDVSLLVQNTRMEVRNIREQAPSVRTVYSDNDWKISVVNLSQDTIKEMALKYFITQNPYCLPYITLINKENLNFAPMDTLVVELDSVGHSNTIFGTDYTSWLRVSVVMVNKNIVKSNGWITGGKTVQNVDIEEHNFTQKDVKVFPNPASSVFNFEFEEEVRGFIKIHDLTGKLFETIPLQKEKGETYELNLSGYPSGVYLVQLQSGEKVFQKKIVKK